MATVLAVAVLALLGACSGNKDKFVVDARFLNMNQANFYVYSPDGVINGIDTIHVNGGRFTYEKAVMQEGTIVLVFPNFTTMPVFVEPGASISIDANAAHLKAMKVEGTEDNEMFTEWRQNTENMSPPELKKQAELFITDHPASPVSRWLLQTYFITSAMPDIKKAGELLKVMLKESDNNVHVGRMASELNRISNLKVGERLPRFTAKDLDGKAIANGPLLSGSTVICVWATWNYESLNALRQLAVNQRSTTDSVRIDHVVTVCLDPSVSQCRGTLRQQNAENLTTICDTLMFDSPLLKSLGITTVPDNIRLKDGKVTGRRLPIMELIKK